MRRWPASAARTWLVALVAAVLVVSAVGCGLAAPSAPRTSPGSPGGTASSSLTPSPTPAPPTSFAVIGDYGMDDAGEAAVARLVASWDPAYILTVGDGYYATAGGKGTAKYDESTGAYYCRWLADITTTGGRCPNGRASTNAFFPAMGNHDHIDAEPAPDTYLTYFDLPGRGFANSSGNERFYDFVQGPIHFFVLDSDPREPEGITSTSPQALWLKEQLAASTATWNIVYDHHPPYSSDTTHGSTPDLQWPFAEWGADAVISGHAHSYERIMRDGIVYFVNGLGGAERYDFTTPVGGSASRYSTTWGAQLVTVTPDRLTFTFINVDGWVIDTYSLAGK